jgi:sentrin-specific protease 7
LNPDWEKAWRNSIIYPKEGKNKATVDKQDIRRLDEGEYLNDNLIMFYLLRLERTLAERSPELAKRIYFHNTFFYERLSKPVKGKKGINYEAVERWTAKVDLFSYDYIIVPVNEHKHWYVAIICNVRKLVNPDLEVIEDSQSQQVSPDARKSQLDVDTRTKSSHTLSPKHHSTRPSATGVDKSLEQMSLTEDADVEEWPSVEPYPGASEETSPRGRSNRQVVEESPRPESTTIDLEETSKPAVTAKKGKRKSTPAPRKYNPKDPRIITLDSLGINHPTTCTNLRDYLIAEMKSKLDKDIPIPRPLGMTAVKIPQQKNYCDCGVFLLSYIEQFLKCPDQFTEDLLQKVDIEVDYDLTPAPKMRTRIRKLLLGLQAEQMIEEKEKAEAKGKAKKKASKAEGKDEAAPSTKSNSREASKSARASIDAESPMSNRASAQPELAEREALQESASRSPQPGGARKESPPERPAESGRHERDTDGLTPESQAGPYFPRTSERASEEDIDLENDTQNVPAMGNASTAASGIGSIFSSISKPFSRLLSDAASSNQTRPGRSRSDAMEISDDSPQKAKHDSPPTFDPDSPSAQLRKEDYQKLISPSPELDENLSDHRGRLPIPYPQQEHDGASPDLDETQDTKGIDKMAVGNDTEITDSSPLQPALKLTSDINDNPNDEEARKEEAIEDNDVMLLDQETVHAPPFLVDPPSTPLTSPRRRKIATSPQRESSRKPNPRKGSKSSEPTNVRRPSGSMAVRDHSDFALIGRHMGKVTKFEGKRTKFSSSP